MGNRIHDFYIKMKTKLVIYAFNSIIVNSDLGKRTLISNRLYGVLSLNLYSIVPHKQSGFMLSYCINNMNPAIN